eukprot:PLAT12669.2.p1 GENE.PLAT12669.2~~PLAT12669.2.p1  ORF type:complete len:318 (+),score=78.30 PLAT12669.2:24-956(+)
MAEDAWVPFSERSEWDDVTPTPQNDGERAPVPIAYTDEFRETHDYFRTILLTGETSERALKLTSEVLDFNNANYTAWQHRRLCLFELGKDLREELAFIAMVAQDTPKNYQLWYHRRVIVDRLGDGSGELAFCASVLEEDSKNYHAWAHRQWALTTFDLWEGETDYVDHLLTEDIRNNSAWNQRWFIAISKHGRDLPVEVRKAELAWALPKLERAPSNESATSFVRGLMRGQDMTLFADTVAALEEILKELAPDSAPLVALLADLLTWAERAEEARAMITALIELDPIRSKYWKRRLASYAEPLRIEEADD